MAATPRLKIHNPQGEYIASCKYYEDAAALVGLYGAGSVVRHADISGARATIWREGSEEISASESYDSARDIMRARVDEAFSRSAKMARALDEGRTKAAVASILALVLLVLSTLSVVYRGEI